MNCECLIIFFNSFNDKCNYVKLILYVNVTQ